MTPELQVTTHFSFLRGASSPEELFATAAALGIPALGIVDRGSLAGIVRCWEAAKTTGVKMVVGARLDLREGASLLVYPTDRPAYSRLTRLLSLGKGRAGKGACDLGWDDVAEWGRGLVAILVADRPDAGLRNDLGRLCDTFGDAAYCGLTRRFRPDDHQHLDAVTEAAHAGRVATVATGDVLYHVEERRILQDVVTCIRLGVTIDEAGFRLEEHADRHLKPPAETARLFARHPEALAHAVEIGERCRFDLGELEYQYPHEVIEPGRTAQETLARLTWEAAARRHPDGIPARETAQLHHELLLIESLKYAPYFLTVHAIVRAARDMRPPILCQGRGSAANSLVCFMLGITAIDPMEKDLLFERFVSMERREPPDIDVDFEHERREEVIQWVYKAYGRHRAALCATVVRYGARGAVREVGKVMGVPEDLTGALAGLVWGWSREGVGASEAASLGLNLEDRRLRLTLDLARELIDTPRHLSQHPGGFVLTEERLDELVPIEPASMEKRQVIEWDKDDIDTMKFMKVDVLGLGMLGCMRRAFDLLEEVTGERHDLSTVPQKDGATYAMIQKADTLGTFQIESRAQMAMLPRMKPRILYDLVIQVAIVRPGPIQGDMVHPYLRRRENPALIDYPTPELERVLHKTLGVPLFQEQAMRVAIECAGFTPGEADSLRRAMATFKLTGKVSLFRDKLINGMIGRGYTPEFAERTFKQIEGFGSYGFPESHAASFALIAYASSWVKCHHPDIFLVAILNSQPMGFYAPAQLVRDARQHGVEVLPPDVNHSGWDTALERPRPVEDSAALLPSPSRLSDSRIVAHPSRAAELVPRSFSPCGRRWPSRQRRSDEGCNATSDECPTPHPSPLRGATPVQARVRLFSRKGRRGAAVPDVRSCESYSLRGGGQDEATPSERGERCGPAGDGSGPHPHLHPLIPVRLGLRLAKGLSKEHVGRIVQARADRAYASIEDLWRRAGVPVAALTRLAEADAYGSLGLGRREALWAIRGLRDEALPLFAAADRREGRLAPEFVEAPVTLAAMSEPREVVEDYRSRGLSLRRHPVAFLRRDLDARRAAPCDTLKTLANGRRVTVAGLVLVRQKPGSAKGVMFITIEDETEVANLVVWPQLFERQRRLILSASMVAARGKVQREGQVIHVVVDAFEDLSHLLRGLGHMTGAEDFPLRTGRGDEAKHGGSPDQRDGDALKRRARDIFIPDLRLGSGIKIPTRDFR